MNVCLFIQSTLLLYQQLEEGTRTRVSYGEMLLIGRVNLTSYDLERFFIKLNISINN